MKDEIVDALSSSYRRELLLELHEQNPLYVPPSPAADELPMERKVRLYHVHLPKLAATGIIDWDRERGIVTEGSHFDEVSPVLIQMERSTEISIE